MDNKELVGLLKEEQIKRDCSDGEMALKLGMDTRQAWQNIRDGKRDLNLGHIALIWQGFENLHPEICAFLRDYKSKKKR